MSLAEYHDAPATWFEKTVPAGSGLDAEVRSVRIHAIRIVWAADAMNRALRTGGRTRSARAWWLASRRENRGRARMSSLLIRAHLRQPKKFWKFCVQHAPNR